MTACLAADTFKQSLGSLFANMRVEHGTHGYDMGSQCLLVKHPPVLFRAIFALTLWCMLSSLSGSGYAAIDDMQTQMLTNFEPNLRWDNVYLGPEWIGGTKPYYSTKNKIYQVRLYPGESVTVRIQKYERLRLLNQRKKLKLEEVTLDVSDGSGLYARVQGAISQDGHSLLSPHALGAPQLIRVTRSPLESTPIEIGLFVSRYAILDTIAPYRKLEYFNDRADRMSSDNTAGLQPFWFFEAGQSRTITLRGPRRYVFESRMLYPSTEERSLQTYQVRSWLDGQLWRMMNVETAQEIGAPMFVNGEPKVLSRLETGYIDVPAGKHTLIIKPNTVLYGRLVMLKSPDYLIPSLNAPKWTPTMALSRSKPSYTRLWQLSANEIRQAVYDPKISPSAKEEVALRLVRDNSHQDGGLIASNMMDESAAQHRDYPEVQNVADRLKEFDTWYQDLLPDEKQTAVGQYFAWMIPPRLLGTGKQWISKNVANQFLQQLLSSLTAAYFFDLPTAALDGTFPVAEYFIPPRGAPSTIRIAVDRERVCQPQSFYVQFGHEKPQLFYTEPKQEVPDAEYSISLAGIGLGVLAQVRGELLYGTLSGLFAETRVNAPLVSAQVLELPLPVGIDKLKIWRASPKKGLLPIAVQYRASGFFALSETGYYDAVNALRPGTDLYAFFVKMLRSEDMPPGLSDPEKELQNNWLPLFREIREQQAVLQNPSIKALQRLAERFLDNGDYEKSLLVSLVLPKRNRNLESVLRAAYQVAWWETYEDALQDLPRETDRAYWKALQALRRSNINQALTYFKQAGARGVSWCKQILTGREIFNAILSADTKRRMDGIQAWARWQFQHPGPYKWQADSSIIRDSSGAKLIHNLTLDSYFQTFMSREGRPVSLEIVGPVRIRIDMRLLLDSATFGQLNGEARVTDGVMVSRVPIKSGEPSPDLKVIGENSYQLGTNTTAEFDLGPGVHYLQVDAGSTPMLLRTFLARPEAATPILPPMNASTTKAAYYHQLEAPKATKAPCLLLSCIWIVPRAPAKQLQSYFARMFPAVDIMHDSTEDQRMPVGLTTLLKSVKLPAKAANKSPTLAFHFARDKHTDGASAKDKPKTTGTRKQPKTTIYGPYAPIDDKKPSSSPVLIDGLKLQGQNKGTWSYAITPEKRKNFIQQNESNFLTLEEFVAPALVYRYFSANQNMYYKTIALSHVRKHGGPVLGLVERLVYQPQWYPFYILAGAEVYSQNPNAKRWDFSGANEWAAYFDNSIFQIRFFNPMTFHIPAFSWKIRRLSLKSTENYSPDRIDQDIYTQYNAAHPKYIKVSDVLFHRPFQDTFWYIRGAIVSTPSLNLIHPDHYKLEIGWRQLIGMLAVTPEYEYEHFVAEGLLRRRYTLYFDWFKWMDSMNFWRIRGNITRGIDVPITVGFISIVWNYNDGRAFRDFFEPDAFNFLNLRTQQVPLDPNNFLLEGGAGE